MEAKILSKRVTLFTNTPMVYNEETITDYIQKLSALKLIPSLNKGVGIKVGPDGSVIPEQMVSLDLKNLNETFKITLGVDRFDIISSIKDEMLNDFIKKTNDEKKVLQNIYPSEYNRIALGLIAYFPSSPEEMNEIYKKLFNSDTEEFPIEWSIRKVTRSTINKDENKLTINNVYTFSRKSILEQGQNIEGLVLEYDINTLIGTNPNDITILYNNFMEGASATIKNGIEVHQNFFNS